MKTLALTGSVLDWAVAKCEGIDLFETEGWVYSDGTRAVFRPSTDWRQGGFIIEREGIDLYQCGNWAAENVDGDRLYPRAEGSTPLIAAMRAYVASKLGDEIEVPEGLQ